MRVRKRSSELLVLIGALGIVACGSETRQEVAEVEPPPEVTPEATPEPTPEIPLHANPLLSLSSGGGWASTQTYSMQVVVGGVAVGPKSTTAYRLDLGTVAALNPQFGKVGGVQ